MPYSATFIQPPEGLVKNEQSPSTDPLHFADAGKLDAAETQQTLTSEQVEKLRYNPPPFTTLPEIAIVIQVSTRTVMRYVEDRRIPVMNRGKHALLFNTRKVLDALEKCS